MKWIAIIWDIIKPLLFGKKRTELDKRIKELSKVIKPLEKSYEIYREQAVNAVGDNQLDHYDGLCRQTKQKINAAYAEFGEAVYNAYRHKG